MSPSETQRKHLIDLVSTKMPYGKFQGRYICDLPEFYLVWYRNKGFPKGKVGTLMASMYEMHSNGLYPLIQQVKKEVHQSI